ncbi:MAG: hydantoinase/oxoprolinase family protein [Xanthobacteraceae bacterium]|nr:hydantoinase/oxoprolinase family protein [Xanthobacteraceae bacterium]
MSYVIAIDIGGTFTDLAACDVETGVVAYTKSPTTYGQLSEAIFDCIRKARLEARQANFVKHGTTLVINALLQRAGARTALLATKGFRDLLEIGRGNRTQPFNLRFHREPPLVPREWRFEVEERVEGSGRVRTPLDKAALGAVAGALKSNGIEALAISFLNSYLAPEHEQEAAAELRRLLPDLFITTGTQLTREWHEFERTATATANAYVGPQVSRYIAEFDAGLRSGGFSGSLLLMGSHGGVISAERGCREPITLVESGPVGGCIGAAEYGRALGVENLVAFDMGGTTACAMIERGRYAVESIYQIGGPDAGFPIRGNVIDILEVGVGGGSIGWLDEQRRLHVGPRSAGSMPGPACYGRDGAEPTVTDANLMLGRLDPGNFLGGEMTLVPERATEVLRDRIAGPLGYRGDDAVTRAAKGVLTIANLTMSSIIKKVSIARGYDPRDFALFCYGGGGPLHGIELARALKIPRVIVPPEPGNFSALGMLLADPRLDTAQTMVVRLGPESLARVTAHYGELEAQGRDALRREFGEGSVSIEREAEMRYKGQHHSIKIAINPEDDAATLRERFDREYLRRYGHTNPADVEIVVLHSLATLHMERPELQRLAQPSAGRAKRAELEVRPVFFLEEDRFLPTQVYDRAALGASFAGKGPALIVEYGSSTLIGPRDTFSIGKIGEIEIDCHA